MKIAFCLSAICMDILALTGFLFGQGIPEITLEDAIERSTERSEIPFDYSDLTSDLSALSERPVNINRLTPVEIERIPFLTTFQQKALMGYLADFGEVFSVYELQAIPGFDSLLVQKIIPFITIGPPRRTPPPTPGNLLKFGRHQVLLRYEQSFPEAAGYKAGDSAGQGDVTVWYPGGPQRFYFRYQYSWFDKITVGVAGEKDPGEQFFGGAQAYGMDYYAWHITVANTGCIQRITLGNFRAGFGQGLTFGSGYSAGSTPGFSFIPPLPSGIRPSLGISEGSYLRGIAASLKFRKFGLTGFASWHPRDANVTRTDTLTGEAGEFSSFTESGYHRTAAEIGDHGSVDELITAVHADYTGKVFRAGITCVWTSYSAALGPSEEPCNRFRFHGSTNLNTGIDFQVRFRSLFLFGELSRSLNGGLAGIAGASFSPASQVDFSVVYRNYEATYQNLNSNAFGQNSSNSNEKGLYLSIRAALHPSFTAGVYADIFRIPWLAYQSDFPGNGCEWGASGVWTSGNLALLFRYSRKFISVNESSSGSLLHDAATSGRAGYRLQAGITAGPQVKLNTRLEIRDTDSKGPQSTGYLVYQEILVNPFRFPVSGTLRYALFDIPGYDQRIYVYEPEVLWGYSAPAYSGKGMRVCLVLKASIMKGLEAWVRGGLTNYFDREVVGTGHDQTEGNLRGEVTLQALVKL